MGKKKTTYNTTGGAGYIPPVTSPVSLTQGLRDRAYHRVRPSGYTYDNAKRFFTDKSRLFEDPNTEGLWGMYTGQDSIIANTTQAPDEMPKGRPLTQEEFIALGRPADDYTEGELAKYAVKDIVIPSRSKEGAYELAYPNKKGTVPHLPYNANDVPESSWPHSHQLGTFHQVKRQDENGTHVTYEDTWDINPFKGQSATDDSSWKDFIDIGRKLGIDKFGNIVPFGKPFEIYGKQYYDKNGKPIKQKADGGFLIPNTPWDNLTLAEKAAMIKVAVNNGILNMPDIRQKYNEFAEGGSKEVEKEDITDEQYINTMEKVAEENYKNWGYNNSDEALVHALNDNTYDYRSYYNKYPQSRANADTHWTDEFKTVYHPTFSNESIYSSKKSQYNPYGLPGGFWVGEDENASFIPMAWQTINNQYKSGGSIHIKPSHRGRLTELKKRTGKTEAELYNDGNPAHRKMVVFARNSRKWHGEGGPLVEAAMQHVYGSGGDADKIIFLNNSYDQPQTFAGRVAQTAGASPSIVRGTDVVSSVAQMTPWGHYVAATDLGRDLNRVYHKENDAKKDVAFDLLSMLPGISAPGLKAAENAWNTIKGNNKLRKALNTGIITGRVADFVNDTWGANKTSKALGGNLFDGTSQPTQQMKIGKPYYSYDENGRKIDDTLNYNISFPEIVITPDSRKSPAERAILERERRRNNDAYYGNGTYNAKADREQTELEKIAGQKAWENSVEKQVLDYAQAAATGVGIGADIVSGLPIYSSLKGTRVLSEAKAPLDYIEGGLWLAPIAGTVGKTVYDAAKPVVSKATNEAAIAWALRNSEVPENFITIKPQVRTRVGDVEVDNPNLLFHLDRGNGAGAFSNQGAYIEDGMLFPGIAKEGEVPYSWWNLGRPYATSIKGQPMTRLMTTTKDTPGMLHVRSQNYPIGQWNGKRGLVLNSEYVNPEGVDVSGRTYTLDPNYGWRKVYAEETPAAEWAMGRTAPKITNESGINSEILQNAFENQPRSIGDIIRGMKEPESMLTPEQNTRISKYANNPKDPSIQMDERLSAGGADRLKADNRVVYHDYPAVITEYVPTDRRTFFPQIQEAIERAQNAYGRRLTDEEIIGIADEISAGKSFAIKDTPYGFVRETLPRVRRGIEKGHEKSHIKVSPKTYSSPLPKDFLEAKWGKDNYMVKNNGDEQLPRLSQIKAYYGKDEISAEELMYAAENYVKDTKVDNNMTDFFDAIKEYAKQHPEIWKEMARYGSETAPIGLSLLYLNKD